MPTGTAEDRGLEVHCRGAGAPVYLVGGGPAFTTWNLGPVQQMLAADHRVCRWDMRGVGDNAGLALPRHGTVLEAWLEDMARVLPPQPVVLWGQSWGALQALMFAHRHPGRVRGVVLSNPVDPDLVSLEHIEERRHHHRLPAAMPTLEHMGTPMEQLLGLRRKLASYFVDGGVGWAWAQGFDLGDSNARLNVRVWEEYRAFPLTAEALAALAPRVAGVIYCADDVLMPHSREAYTGLFPDARHAIIEDCGHFPWVERPRDYAAELRPLVERAQAGGDG